MTENVGLRRIVRTDGPQAAIGVGIGVTERKQAEAALWESEDRYHTLFDLSPVAVYSCDASGVIEKFNRRAVELWVASPSEVIPTSAFAARSNCSARTAASCLTSSVQWPR